MCICVKEEDETVEDIVYSPLRTFRHDIRPHAIAWSPETSLSVVPKVLMFCVAGADFKIRLYNSDMNENTVCEVRLRKVNIHNLPYKKLQYECISNEFIGNNNNDDFVF